MNSSERKSDKPTVVVIIPFYNGSKWIERAVESVHRQTVPPDEFIIVNDGSQPEERQALDNLSDKYLFKIIDKLKIKYGIFAGSSIGYLRDKRNMYWTDDYDILVFKDSLKEDLIKLNIWEKNGFDCYCPEGIYANGGCQLLSKQFFKNKYFQCDIFYSWINNNDNIIYNNANWGLYHGKLTKDIVLFGLL
jgi:cellulose synthase/poly-beta-1,6-N-acetylglucosamine synthase-like glycosyltransferase